MSSATTVRRVVLSIIGVLLAVAVASGGIGMQMAASKTSVAAPTFTSQPANPANSTTANFIFTGPTGATFQCKLDAAAFAVCTSSKTYTALAQGSHTFQVKAVAGSAESAATSYTWTVDTTPPPVPSITAKPASLSNTTSPSFSFTDTEPGVTFRCQLDGSASACSSPRSYSGLAQGANTFAVQAVDAAGNSSGSATWAWSIDSLAPAAPVLTTKPDDPTYNATNTFAWSLSEPGLTFQCSKENEAWFTCSTPYTWVIVTSNYGQHQFAVRAIDAAGNVSAATSYTFKYEKKLPTSGLPFQITGSVSGLTLGTFRPIAVTISNPNGVLIYVSALTVAISPNSTPAGCTSSDNVDLVQSNVSTSLMVAVPANGSVVLPAQGAVAPQIRLKDLPTVNQDACKGTSFTLTYSGTASN
jgi:hypothetical protein